MIQLNSNLLGFFPLLVGGNPPPASDVFTPTSNNLDQFTVAMGTMPSGPDAGDPAVVVTCLTLNGAAGVSFSVTDSNNDPAATETFDIIPPAAVPTPITVDDPAVVTQPNPNPPTA